MIVIPLLVWICLCQFGLSQRPWPHAMKEVYLLEYVGRMEC